MLNWVFFCVDLYKSCDLVSPHCESRQTSEMGGKCEPFSVSPSGWFVWPVLPMHATKLSIIIWLWQYDCHNHHLNIVASNYVNVVVVSTTTKMLLVFYSAISTWEWWCVTHIIFLKQFTPFIPPTHVKLIYKHGELLACTETQRKRFLWKWHMFMYIIIKCVLYMCMYCTHNTTKWDDNGSVSNTYIVCNAYKFIMQNITHIKVKCGWGLESFF